MDKIDPKQKVFPHVSLCDPRRLTWGNTFCRYTEPQKKRLNFNNSIRYGKQSIYFFFFKLQVFIAAQSVGTHQKKLSNNKLPLHQDFIVSHIDNCMV